MHCLNAIRDDLHDYAEAIQRRMVETLGVRPVDAMTVASFECAVLHRAGLFQTELVRIKPFVCVPMHSHPGVDSVDLLVAGNVWQFRIGTHTLKRFVKGMGLRIASTVPHGGVASEAGVMFLSCQRWAVAPSFIAREWQGEPVNDTHARMIDALEAVA